MVIVKNNNKNLISSDLSFEELNYLNEENRQLIEKKIDLPEPQNE